MSETCGGCVYDGRPLSGVEVRIDDGEVQLRGLVQFDGYEDDRARTAAVMKDGWFRTNDLGRLDDDGRLWVTGRADDVIISGGVKIPAQALAARLREHPGVEAVEVLGVPDDEWGQRVVAFVVGDIELDDLRDYVSQELPREWAPRQVVTLPDLPLLSNGKVHRLMLRDLA